MLESALEADLIQDAAVAASHKEAASFWLLRDAVAEFPTMWTPSVGFDVSVPIGRIGEFAETLRARVLAAWPGAEMMHFGHVGDSNLHFGVRLPGVDAADFPEHDITDLAYGVVRDFQGSISAEHGVGFHKKPYLHCSRSPEELALMRLLKRALDPNHILSPGRVFDLG